MQIGTTNPIPAVAAVDRHATNPQQQAHAPTKAAAEAAPKKVFTPAPPLRPTVQDYVDIDRTLISLRTL